jgi:exopolyphosphatase/guanosine-5'-triphosphate,3'-diphosphate pyrophosphatase
VDSVGITDTGERRAECDAPGARTRVPLFGAIDLGTNNCRLLVAEATADGFRVVDAFSRIVRLGEGVGTTGRLSPDAMRRTWEALRVCAGKLARHRVGHVRAVATEACRRAENFTGFRHHVARTLGIELDLIAAEEEARLAVAGCAPLLDPGVDRALVFDIGGGSTEVMWLAGVSTGRPAMTDGISLPYGVVSLSEAFGGREVTEAAYDAMVAEVGRAVARFEARTAIAPWIAAGAVQMIGCSGTVTTLAGVRMGLPRYDRARVDGAFLSFDEARETSRALLALDYAGRVGHPCIGRDRADLVLAGCAVLDAICAQWPVGRLRIADRGVREGILFDLIAAHARDKAAREAVPA